MTKKCPFCGSVRLRLHAEQTYTEELLQRDISSRFWPPQPAYRGYVECMTCLARGPVVSANEEALLGEIMASNWNMRSGDDSAEELKGSEK